MCKQWYNAFYLPLVWRNFLVDDRTLTRAKYNYYSGWQYCLDHIRTQNCLSRVGKYLRGLEFRPEHSFNNIFQFMTMLSWSMTKVGTEMFSVIYLNGIFILIYRKKGIRSESTIGSQECWLTHTLACLRVPLQYVTSQRSGGH